MTSLKERVRALPERAAALAAQARDAFSLADEFEAHCTVSRLLGGHAEADAALFGFWTPELQDAKVADADVFLEVLAPREAIDVTRAAQDVVFERAWYPVARDESYTFAAVAGMKAGTRETVGDFYALTWRDADGEWHRILDPLALSLPYGAFAPAELLDAASLHEGRTDTRWFRDFGSSDAEEADAPRRKPPSNILQIHVPTATAGGTLASLARRFERVAEKIENARPLEPADELLLGYDAVQLLPVEPTTVYETGPPFWRENGDAFDAELAVHLQRPDTTNWGYDVVIAGMATVNPTLLESGRPHELVDLAAVLHTFPTRPKMLILDVVFGHSDNQGLDVLNRHFFAGPNMYGQNLDYRNPAVRAILLEMQRRKVDFGADGVRVDGAQDFKFYDAGTGTMVHDDAYLDAMSAVVQQVAGARYRPWFVFEDGRPWPEPDWELASDYRAVIRLQAETDPDVFQWGPLTFAHNTPFLYTYWLSKLWRIREMCEVGANWISGTANHDTLRRGTQVDPLLNINTRLGDTHMEILDKAYDNPAVSTLTYAALPGVPMDFLNASARASWGFIRNQDDRWGVKVVAEEAISLGWQVDEYSYSRPGNFRRLKDLGFATRAELARFFEFLPALVEVTGYDLEEIARLANVAEPPLAGPAPYSPERLKVVARAWMDDMHEYCNVAHAHSTLVPENVSFSHRLRDFRRDRPWLRHNLREDDHFDHLRPIDGRTVFTGLRHGPDGKDVYMIAHMEGAPTPPIDPLALPVPGLGNGWTLALKTPGVDPDYENGEIVLHDSHALVWERSS